MKTLNKILEAIHKNEIALVYISSLQCGACMAIAPKVDEIVNENKNIHLIKVDINQAKEVTGQWMVFTVPTLLVFHKGKEIHREARFIQFDRLKYYLDLIQ